MRAEVALVAGDFGDRGRETGVDLREILDRCRRGDGLAWEALVTRFQGRVYGLAFHYMRSREEARDVAQEIFVRLYEKLGTFHDHETFIPWMLRVGRNVCIDHLRRARSRGSDSGVPIDETPEPADSRQTPEDAAAGEEDRRLVRRALEKLNEPYREMILLKDIQGLRMEEIASMLEVPLGTVKSRSSRARIELARRVRELITRPGERS